MNILKMDVGVKSSNFFIKIVLSTIVAFSTLVAMYYSFRI